jgi:hypothetical protein
MSNQKVIIYLFHNIKDDNYDDQYSILDKIKEQIMSNKGHVDNNNIIMLILGYDLKNSICCKPQHIIQFNKLQKELNTIIKVHVNKYYETFIYNKIMFIGLGLHPTKDIIEKIKNKIKNDKYHYVIYFDYHIYDNRWDSDLKYAFCDILTKNITTVLTGRDEKYMVYPKNKVSKTQQPETKTPNNGEALFLNNNKYKKIDYFSANTILDPNLNGYSYYFEIIIYNNKITKVTKILVVNQNTNIIKFDNIEEFEPESKNTDKSITRNSSTHKKTMLLSDLSP